MKGGLEPKVAEQPLWPLHAIFTGTTRTYCHEHQIRLQALDIEEP